MTRPLVIGHRGACGYLPEHTLASYALAMLQGADYIEPDLVATRDGVLVARHENEIGGTTDVGAREEFSARRRIQSVDGEQREGWFVEDFTLQELRTLHARERLPQLRPASAASDGQFGVPTFDEVLELLAGVNASRRIAGQPPVGVYPETKHPSHFAALGLPLEPPLLASLKAGLRGAPVYIQSFDPASLQQLRGMGDYPLTQLMNSNAVMDIAGFEPIALYAQAVGVPKNTVMSRSSLVRDAHAAGLKVHVWTFRAENVFLPAELRRGADPATHGDLAAEIRQHLAAGIDGLFSDQPDLARAAVDSAP